MQLFAGTSGYSYKEWKGTFYPDKLPAEEMLRYYAQRLPTVEINNTFYRMPAESVLWQWSEQVPDGFAFTLKAQQRISHVKRLREADADMVEFLRRAAVLAGKLAQVLIQLPPQLRKDLPRLEAFLAQLPDHPRFVFEFRHASWQDDSVYQALRSRGAIWCIADTDEGDTQIVATADRGYLRLRREQYDDEALRGWVERIAAQPWSQAFVYFKHEDAGLGAKFAQRIGELWTAGRGATSTRDPG